MMKILYHALRRNARRNELRFVFFLSVSTETVRRKLHALPRRFPSSGALKKTLLLHVRWFWISRLESHGELTTARGAHKRTLMPRPLVNHPALKGLRPLENPRGFRAASTSGDTCRFFGASLFGSGCFDLHGNHPRRVSNQTILCQHRSTALRGVLMQTFTHQNHTAVGRRRCNSNRSVNFSKMPVPYVNQNVQD